MIFKAHWEKTQRRVSAPDEPILRKMLGHYTTENDVKSVSLISGGCANMNYLAHLFSLDQPVILRIYIRDQDSVFREQKISLLLKGKLPVPQFYQVGEYDGYTFV